ncbi:MAG: heparinase II/III family protein [Fimbriimonadaceae bacterium]|nr:heparinase II/III family protein [Fimbriimonadaceae bacterium]
MPTALWTMAVVCALGAPQLPPQVGAGDLARLRNATAAVRALSPAALRQLVPTQSGLFFVGCANCSGGKQEDQLDWDLHAPGQARCRYCGHRYPSPQYPTSGVERHVAPNGETVEYPYWQNAKGYRHFFEARRDYQQREFLERQALALAQLAFVQPDPAVATLAVTLLDQFAAVYPRYCFHYDYPFQPKVIYDGQVPPEQFRSNFRTARWYWWAYADVPVALLRAYDLLRDDPAWEALPQGAAAARRRFEQEFLQVACEQVLANREDYGNMSPVLWWNLVAAGRVLGEPRYVHEPLQRLQRLMATQFYRDGAWSEGAPSYQQQVLGNLELLQLYSRGYSDPPTWQPPAGQDRLTDLDLRRDLPALARSLAALAALRLPNGRRLPVHDTWALEQGPPLEQSRSVLLGALGQACLGRGRGAAQQQAWLTWSGGYGHQHGDGLALNLFARGREWLPDLGYTHTAWRGWTITSLSHNLVVIDGQPQALGNAALPTDGNLRWWLPDDGALGGVSVDNPEVYPQRAQTYRRTVLQVGLDDRAAYLVDCFEVVGGQQHDYLLWGPPDEPATLQLSLAPGSPLPSLLPAGVPAELPTAESQLQAATQPHLAYAFLSDLRRATATAATTADFQVADAGLRATLCTAPGDQVISARAPTIRHAGEDDRRLPEATMPGLLWRRQATASTFLSILEPHPGEPRVAAQRLAWPACLAAVEVRCQRPERQDLLLLQPQGLQAVWQGRQILATGAAAVLQADQQGLLAVWLVGPGELRVDQQSWRADPATVAVTAIEADGLVLDAPLRVGPGDLVLVTHGDGRVSPYHVRTATVDGKGQRLTTVEAGGFGLDATGRAQATGHPQRSHPGPHRAAPTAIVAWRRGA